MTTMQITIEVPTVLGQRLLQFQSRLIEVLERGLRELDGEEREEVVLLDSLLENLAPETIWTLHPSPALQKRVSELLEKHKREVLGQDEETELNRYLSFEHLVRLAKANTYQELTLQ